MPAENASPAPGAQFSFGQAITLSVLIATAGGVWMLRNWIQSGNPVYPVEVSVFPDTTLSRGGIPTSIWRNKAMQTRFRKAAPRRVERGVLMAGYVFGGAIDVPGRPVPGRPVVLPPPAGPEGTFGSDGGDAPDTDLRSGIRKTLAWYREQHWI